MNKPFIEVENLSKHFTMGASTVAVLKKIDLTIERGEVLAILGRSGAGKSTLLHILGTLDSPTNGSIRIEDEDIFKRKDTRLSQYRNQNIGFVFQGHFLLPEFTALENVLLPALIAGTPRDQAEENARACLDMTEMGHRENHRPGEMSGGECQRVALSRALVQKPKILLADEPTGNLDTKTGNLVHELFFEVNRQLGTTIVIVTHNETHASRFPRRIQLNDGFLV